MTDLALAAADLLALVLIVAAVAKLRNPNAVRWATQAFGVPVTVAPFIAPTELVTAVLLVLLPRVGAVMASVVLLVFTAVVVRSLVRHQRVACACFGSSTEPVSAATVVRNVALLAAAITAAAGPASPAIPRFAAVVTVTSLGAISALIVALVGVGNTTGSMFGSPGAAQAAGPTP